EKASRTTLAEARQALQRRTLSDGRAGVGGRGAHQGAVLQRAGKRGEGTVDVGQVAEGPGENLSTAAGRAAVTGERAEEARLGIGERARGAGDRPRDRLADATVGDGTDDRRERTAVGDRAAERARDVTGRTVCQ